MRSGCMRTIEQMHVSICLVIFNCKDYYIILLSQYLTIATIYFDSILVISYFNTTIYYYGDILIRHYFTTTLLYIHTYKVHFRQTTDESCRRHTHTHTHKYKHTYCLFHYLSIFQSVRPTVCLSTSTCALSVSLSVLLPAKPIGVRADRQIDRQTDRQRR